MKKLFAALLSLSMLLSFTACGEEEEKGTDNKDNASVSEDVKESGGEEYNAGNVTAYVPSGWKAFPVADIFSDEANATNPDAVEICKGGESDIDLFSKPYVHIDFYNANDGLIEPSKDWYDDAADVTPIKAGDLTWEGFTATNVGIKMALLWTTDSAGNQYQANIFLEASDGTISLEDSDVIEILASVKPSA